MANSGSSKIDYASPIREGPNIITDRQTIVRCRHRINGFLALLLHLHVVLVVQSIRRLLQEVSGDLQRPVRAEVVGLSHEPVVDGLVRRVGDVLSDPAGVPAAEGVGLPLRDCLVTLEKIRNI